MLIVFFISLAWQLLRAMVVLSIMASAVAIMMAAWLIVALVGLVHPRLTPRQACDWFREFLGSATAQVKSLAE